MKCAKHAVNLYIVAGGPVLSTSLLIPDWLASTDQNSSLFEHFKKHGMFRPLAGGLPLVLCRLDRHQNMWRLFPYNMLFLELKNSPSFKSSFNQMCIICIKTAPVSPMLPPRPGNQPSHWERACSFPLYHAARG